MLVSNPDALDRVGLREHLPPLRDIIDALAETDPDTWWEGPTFRSECQTKHCVLSHIYEMYGAAGFEEFEDAYSTSFYIGYMINDRVSDEYPQTHPKDRVLAYLEAMLRGDEYTTWESVEAA